MRMEYQANQSETRSSRRSSTIVGTHVSNEWLERNVGVAAILRGQCLVVRAGVRLLGGEGPVLVVPTLLSGALFVFLCSRFGLCGGHFWKLILEGGR